MPEFTFTDAELDRLADALADRVAARVLASSDQCAPELMTIRQAAQTLGRHPKTIHRRIADGSLPAVSEHGRTMVRADDLRAYVERLEHVGSSGSSRRQPRSTSGRFNFLRD